MSDRSFVRTLDAQVAPSLLLTTTRAKATRSTSGAHNLTGRVSHVSTNHWRHPFLEVNLLPSPTTHPSTHPHNPSPHAPKLNPVIRPPLAGSLYGAVRGGGHYPRARVARLVGGLLGGWRSRRGADDGPLSDRVGRFVCTRRRVCLLVGGVDATVCCAAARAAGGASYGTPWLVPVCQRLGGRIARQVRARNHAPRERCLCAVVPAYMARNLRSLVRGSAVAGRTRAHRRRAASCARPSSAPRGDACHSDESGRPTEHRWPSRATQEPTALHNLVGCRSCSAPNRLRAVSGARVSSPVRRSMYFF